MWPPVLYAGDTFPVFVGETVGEVRNAPLENVIRTTLPFCSLRRKKGNQYLLSSLPRARRCAKYFIYSISQHSHSLCSYSVCDTETPTGIWWLAQIYEAQKGWSQNANLSYLIPKSMSLPIIILLCCIDTVVHEKSSYLIPFCMRTGHMCVRVLDVKLCGPRGGGR